MDGLGREGGRWGYGQRFARCLFGREVGGVGWLGAGSLHGAAPSRGWLPRGGGSLERAYNRGTSSSEERRPFHFPRTRHEE